MMYGSYTINKLRKVEWDGSRYCIMTQVAIWEAATDEEAFSEKESERTKKSKN